MTSNRRNGSPGLGIEAFAFRASMRSQQSIGIQYLSTEKPVEDHFAPHRRLASAPTAISKLRFRGIIETFNVLSGWACVMSLFFVVGGGFGGPKEQRSG